jgi:hypothetical protein
LAGYFDDISDSNRLAIVRVFLNPLSKPFIAEVLEMRHFSLALARWKFDVWEDRIEVNDLVKRVRQYTNALRVPLRNFGKTLIGLHFEVSL